MAVEDESGSTYVNAFDHVMFSLSGFKTNPHVSILNFKALICYIIFLW
jgi:hypothetical protein